MTGCPVLRAYMLAEKLIMFSWIHPRLDEFSPNLAETGTRFLRGTRRSLHVFSRGNSHFMWRLKFSLRIDRITLTMLLLLSLSLEGRKHWLFLLSYPASIPCLLPSRGTWGRTDSKWASKDAAVSPHLEQKWELIVLELPAGTKIWDVYLIHVLFY